jgi:hypothetical protein
VLRNPSDNTTLEQGRGQSFSWQPVTDATLYRLRVSTDRDDFDDANDCDGCIFNNTTTNTSLSIPDGDWPVNRTLYWSVRAGDPSQERGGLWATPRALRLEAPVTCHIETSPALNVWTIANPTTQQFAECDCNEFTNPYCHAIYKGRVVALEGNRATLEFAKDDNSGPSLDVSFWIGVTGVTPSVCNNLTTYGVRSGGIWPAEQTLRVEVPIWPEDQPSDTFEGAAPGDSKKLFVISGGAGMPNNQFWFQHNPITFTKVCQ